MCYSNLVASLHPDFPYFTFVIRRQSILPVGNILASITSSCAVPCLANFIGQDAVSFFRSSAQWNSIGTQQRCGAHHDASNSHEPPLGATPWSRNQLQFGVESQPTCLHHPQYCPICSAFWFVHFLWSRPFLLRITAASAAASSTRPSTTDSLIAATTAGGNKKRRRSP